MLRPPGAVGAGARGVMTIRSTGPHHAIMGGVSQQAGPSPARLAVRACPVPANPHGTTWAALPCRLTRVFRRLRYGQGRERRMLLGIPVDETLPTDPGRSDAGLTASGDRFASPGVVMAPMGGLRAIAVGSMTHRRSTRGSAAQNGRGGRESVGAAPRGERASAEPAYPVVATPDTGGPGGGLPQASGRARGPSRAVFRPASARQDLGTTMLGNLTVLGIGLLTGIISARLLGPVGRGQLAAIQLWPGFLGSLALIGQAEALPYFSAKSPDGAARYASTSLALGLAGAVLAGGVGWVVLPRLLASQAPATVATARVYLAFIPVYVVLTLLPRPLWGLRRFRLWNALRVLPTMVWLGVLLVAWLAGGATSHSVADHFLAALAVLVLPVVIICRSQLPGWGRPSWADAKPLLHFGVPAMATAAPGMVNLRLDQLVLAGIVSPHLLGLYVVAVAAGNITFPILHGLGTVLLPRLADAKRTDASSKALFSQGVRLSVLLAVPLSVPLAVAVRFGLVPLFGRRFGDAIPAALILVAAGAVYGVNFVLSEGLRGLGRPRGPLFAETCAVPVTVGLLLMLIRPLGITGAAISSLAGYVVVMLALVIQVRAALSLSAAELLMPGGNDISMVLDLVRHLRDRLSPGNSRS